MQRTAADVKDLFEDLKSEWKSKSQYMSNSARIATVWEYQQIIGLGPQVVPIILAELERETDHWFWALEAITGINPVNREDAGNVAKMAGVWLAWGRGAGLV